MKKAKLPTNIYKCTQFTIKDMTLKIPLLGRKCEQIEASSYTVGRHRNWYKETFLHPENKGGELSNL